MSSTAVTFMPVVSYPPTPFNTADGVESRSRANSLMSTTSNSSPVPSERAHTTPVSVSSDVPRRGPPRNVAFVNFAHVYSKLSKIQEEDLDDGPTTVPKNTPCVTEASLTPRSQVGPKTFNLPSIDKRLEELPEPAASIFSSPSPSVFGDNQSTVSEPIYIAIRPRPASEPTPRAHKASNEENPASPSPAQKAGVTNSPGFGTREYTDWAADIEADLQRVLTRLANLANDDHQRDASSTASEHYSHRVSRLLGDSPLEFHYVDDTEFTMPIPSEQPTSAKEASGTTVPAAKRSTSSELARRLETNEKDIERMAELHNAAVKEFRNSQKGIKSKLGETNKALMKMQESVAAMQKDSAQTKQLIQALAKKLDSTKPHAGAENETKKMS